MSNDFDLENWANKGLFLTDGEELAKREGRIEGFNQALELMRAKIINEVMNQTDEELLINFITKLKGVKQYETNRFL